MVLDVGHSLNPAIDIGQIDGAFVQGLGHVTTEQLRHGPQGEILTNNLRKDAYKKCLVEPQRSTLPRASEWFKTTFYNFFRSDMV